MQIILDFLGHDVILFSLFAALIRRTQIKKMNKQEIRKTLSQSQ